MIQNSARDFKIYRCPGVKSRTRRLKTLALTLKFYKTYKLLKIVSNQLEYRSALNNEEENSLLDCFLKIRNILDGKMNIKTLLEERENVKINTFQNMLEELKFNETEQIKLEPLSKYFKNITAEDVMQNIDFDFINLAAPEDKFLMTIFMKTLLLIDVFKEHELKENKIIVTSVFTRKTTS